MIQFSLKFILLPPMKISDNTKAYFDGLRDGTPIGLGYFAVAFSLGIVAQKAGLTATQGFVASFLNMASAGEYALFTSIISGATYVEVAIATLIINARYLLMSCSLSQKFSQDTPYFHRFFVGFGITDEIFGISIAQKGMLNPRYTYGALTVAMPLWALGTSFGIIAGNSLPIRIVSAFSVALYGMFLAIIVPPAKQSVTILAAVIISFLSSLTFAKLPYISKLSAGTRIIVLTIVISAVFAMLKPIKDNEIEVQK